jgi:DNA-directed RNA polymerase
MKADKPWQFLAACNEWLKQEQSGEGYNFLSGIECFIDGSNNGSQHLSALTKDEVTAPHVNLVPLDLPGDLYKYVADDLWLFIAEQAGMIHPKEQRRLNKVIDDIIELKRQMGAAPVKSEVRKQLIEDIKVFRNSHSLDIVRASPLFWSRITDTKHRRKVVKRNVMTLPYGGTAYGLGQQQVDDAKKHGIDLLMSMEHKWGQYLGRSIHTVCVDSLRRPMRLLSIFEDAGNKAEGQAKFLKWSVPITGFPVVQHYTEGTVHKMWVQYGPAIGERNSTGYYENTLQLNICFLEKPQYSLRKQAQGASPNAIHSLDAAHLMITVSQADFPITTIHDSFGCLLADMPKLFTLIRSTFVELYRSDPLSSLMRDIDGDISSVEIGTLDVSLVADSEYCFA